MTSRAEENDNILSVAAEIRHSTVELCTVEVEKSNLVSAPEIVSNVPSEGSLTASLHLLRIGSLLFLALQYASVVLLMRYARKRPGDMFMATTAVVASEILKVAVCLVFILCEHRFNLFAFVNYLSSNTVQRPVDCLKISVPATIYVLQSNLVYVALSNLDTIIFLVTNQLKIFTTAVFSVLILRKQLSGVQWLALGLLIVGVSTVEMHGGIVEQNQANSSFFTASEKKNASVVSSTASHRERKENFTLGILAVLAACVMSGFAGVYYEKLLKNTAPSICLRNVQLGVLGVFFGVMAAWYIDGTKIAAKGFFCGYDVIVWAIVVLQSLGGLLIGVAVKYADNIEKGFATSAAIVLTCVVSVIQFSLDLTPTFCFGVTLVIASTYIYA